MGRLTHSANTTTLNAIRFIVARKDDLGIEFRNVFEEVVPDRYKDSFFDNPFAFDNHYILGKVREACELFFGTTDWYLCLRNSENEKVLLNVLRFEDTLSTRSIEVPKEDALKQVSARIYRFKLLYNVYINCNDKSKEQAILSDTSLQY